MIMIVSIIIIAILLVGICASLLFMDGSDIIVCLLGVVFGLVIMILAILVDSKPKAMDVYRGKTTLEVTYKDGIPMDSIVVFK